MSTTQDRFQLSPQTRVLTPEVAGLAELLTALKAGQSILARPGDAPISPVLETKQWLYCQSSGSTGYAKTIRRTPQSWIRSFEMDRERFGLSSADVYASLGTLSHSLTLFATVAACHMGADLAMLGERSPRRQMRELLELKVTVLYATPAQLRLLLRAGPTEPLRQLRLIFSSGGKLDPATRAALAALCPGATVQEIFGASETSYMTLAGPDAPPESVGRAYPGVELRIADADAAGVGEIWMRSPYLFDGYEQGQSAETRWQGGWLTIGEMGWIDAAGNLYPKGRRNRMVTVADRNVFPEEIEAVLMQADGVEAAVALALPDVRRGHRIVAVVQGTAPARVLRQLCRQDIGDHAVPRDIRHMEALPMLAAGKPDLQALRRLLEVE
ncbi:AMP-binding protein [Epibacterium sp. Ofav1-8]|uniref:AMP-binding protein n=1 Tax=Epibacterium sp. Ofav1-8 TaxID=2917735 RepID=UPI001EF62F43|nr:AMP-binding protein [Epibacterium sp. Ofav1-8]MCG7625786.1 AMP-binding protein [Epibacterium sp. Ofav1-8]